MAPVALGTGRTATAVTAGDAHTCVLLDDGTVKCWGSGTNGLGQGNTDHIGDQPDEMGDSLAPVALGTGLTATAITTGISHTCVLLDDGTVKCWGSGGNGRLGQGNTANIGYQPDQMGNFLPPIKLGVGHTATAITAGSLHTCTSLDDGTVKCWGLGSFGRLGQEDTNTIGDQPNEMGDNLDGIALGAGAGALVVPVTVTPAAPVAVTATANSSVTVAWTAPSDNGGAAITGTASNSPSTAPTGPPPSLTRRPPPPAARSPGSPQVPPSGSGWLPSTLSAPESSRSPPRPPWYQLRPTRHPPIRFRPIRPLLIRPGPLRPGPAIRRWIRLVCSTPVLVVRPSTPRSLVVAP